MAVKTPVDKLGTVIKTISGVEQPWGVAVNKSGEVIVAEDRTIGNQSINNYVSIFSPTGEKLRTLDTTGTAVGEMKCLRGVAVDLEDNILVSDAANNRLLKFSRGGDLIAAVGKKRSPALMVDRDNHRLNYRSPCRRECSRFNARRGVAAVRSEGDDPGQFQWPCGVCVNSTNEKVYVVDTGTNCVKVFNSDLTFSNKFGSWGIGEGQFALPWDIASDSSGRVYVADTSNKRVQVFTSDGGFLRQFGKEGSGNGELNFPTSICVDSDDRVYVAELSNSRVSVFTSEGEFLKLFGSQGTEPGQFKRPYGIAVDQSGLVYVSDHGNNRVQSF